MKTSCKTWKKLIRRWWEKDCVQWWIVMRSEETLFHFSRIYKNRIIIKPGMQRYYIWRYSGGMISAHFRYNWRSSAYEWKNMSGIYLNISNIGRRYTLKNKGPSTKPWSTACVVRRGGDWWPLIKTWCSYSHSHIWCEPFESSSIDTKYIWVLDSLGLYR